MLINNINMKYIFLSTLLLFVCLTASAQKYTLTGKVTLNGEPLIGVTIMIKGRMEGTVTDSEGNYRLQVYANDTLLVSFIGMTVQEIPVNGRTRIDIEMVSDDGALNDIISYHVSSFLKWNKENMYLNTFKECRFV